MTDLGEEREEFFGVTVRAVGLVRDHVGKVFDAVQVLGSLVELVADLILQILRQPDQTGDAALCLEEMCIRDRACNGSIPCRRVRSTSPAAS